MQPLEFNLDNLELAFDYEARLEHQQRAADQSAFIESRPYGDIDNAFDPNGQPIADVAEYFNNRRDIHEAESLPAEYEGLSIGTLAHKLGEADFYEDRTTFENVHEVLQWKVSDMLHANAANTPRYSEDDRKQAETNLWDRVMRLAYDRSNDLRDEQERQKPRVATLEDYRNALIQELDMANASLTDRSDEADQLEQTIASVDRHLDRNQYGDSLVEPTFEETFEEEERQRRLPVVYEELPEPPTTRRGIRERVRNVFRRNRNNTAEPANVAEPVEVVEVPEHRSHRVRNTIGVLALAGAALGASIFGAVKIAENRDSNPPQVQTTNPHDTAVNNFTDAWNKAYPTDEAKQAASVEFHKFQAWSLDFKQHNPSLEGYAVNTDGYNQRMLQMWEEYHRQAEQNK